MSNSRFQMVPNDEKPGPFLEGSMAEQTPALCSRQNSFGCKNTSLCVCLMLPFQSLQMHNHRTDSWRSANLHLTRNFPGSPKLTFAHSMTCNSWKASWCCVYVPASVPFCSASRPVQVTEICVPCSIVIFKALLAPGFRWLVGNAIPAWASALDASLYLVYTFTWLFPVYIISFIVNCLW